MVQTRAGFFPKIKLNLRLIIMILKLKRNRVLKN
uniref:Uncharacterized protein n=1 Tax=Anguilla anguilla TaxID=7936 RepID=A0A0E9UHQ0_ANGAN